MTAHIESKKEDISKSVLMVGDPRRAEYIAKNYLEEYKCINEVRGMLAFTGKYKGKTITIFSHGMGIPSMGIYSYELFNFYGVETIIRLGTAGSYTSRLDVGDVLLVNNSYTKSTYAHEFDESNELFLSGSKKLNDIIKLSALNDNINLKEANIECSDVFYSTYNNDFHSKYNLEAVEMESYALFKNAMFFNKNASCILTISNSFVNNKELSSEQREKQLNSMIKLALDSIINA